MSDFSKFPSLLQEKINDGVCILDHQGNLLYANRRASFFLDTANENVFLNRAHPKTAFHRFLADTVFGNTKQNECEVNMRDEGGSLRRFHVTSSPLQDEEQNEVGILFLFSDVTEKTYLLRQRKNAITLLIALFISMYTYFLFFSALDYWKINMETQVLTQLIHVIILSLTIFLFAWTRIPYLHFGLRIKNPRATVLYALSISLALVAAMVLLKGIIIKAHPQAFGETLPFWNAGLGKSRYLIYIFTAILQEFLAHSVAQESFERIFEGEHAPVCAILLSALIVSIMHIAHGFVYMIGAFVLIFALGFLYKKLRNIWAGACIHYVFGIAGTCLGFIGV